MAAKYTLNADDIAATNETATRLGVSPTDLLTAMAYETVGTLNPDIKGLPDFRTAQKGDYFQGLIQFGGPEQKKYGYAPGMTFADQMRGPVYNYLSTNGLKPGMGLGHIYSIILTGGLTKNGQPRWGVKDLNGSVRFHVANMVRAYGAMVRNILGSPAVATPDDIKQLQAQLQAEGLYKGKIDGIWGPLTQTAYDTFKLRESSPQTARGIGSDFVTSRAHMDGVAIGEAREVGLPVRSAISPDGRGIVVPGKATGLTPSEETRAAFGPRARPTFAQAQQAILGGTSLRKGAGTKAANAEVQKFLNAQGVTDYKGRALKVDGIIGARTRSAIIAYQINRGLRPDGVVGIKTLADMAAVQEQADNPVTRPQSPEMGGDRFNVAQVIEGQAPGLPGGQSFGEALARQMGAGMAINLASFGGAESVNYTPAFYGSGYTQMNAGIGSDVGAAARDPFAQLTIDVNDKMGELAAPQTHLADFSQVNSGIGSDAAASARAPFAQLTIDVNNKMREMSGSDASGLSSEALQFQADLTPSLGGATGSSLGGTGGATTAVLSNYARTARELAAAKAIQAGRDISLGAAADPFAALRAASLAQSNAFNLASAQAAAQAAAELNAAGGAGGAFTGGGGSQSGGTPSGETRSSAGNTTSTSPGTSPGSPSVSGGSNTVSNPGSMGGSSTSPGTSSSLGGGGTRTGSSSRANP